VLGGFADIWKGQQDGEQVCIKAFRTQTVPNSERIKRRFYREIVGWKYLSHPNVVPFLGVSEASPHLSIISPWLSNGNIVVFTRRNPRVNRLRLLAQAACGLKYLHARHVVHSGITPGNILITEEGAACLGDFGITGTITDPTVVSRETPTTKPGASRYMAPELLYPRQFGLKNSNPSKESDIYSFSMTAYKVLSGDTPYDGVRLDSVAAINIVSGNRPPRPTNPTADRWLSDPVWDVIRRGWHQEPRFRLSAESLHRGFAEPQLEHEEETPGPTLVTQRREAAIDTGGQVAPLMPGENRPANRAPTSTRPPRKGPKSPGEVPPRPRVKSNRFKALLFKFWFSS